MSSDADSLMHAVVVETHLQFSLVELSQACGVEVTLLESLVHEGVLMPLADDPTQWRFAGAALARARRAIRLQRDLELSIAGTALVLELLDEVDALKSQLRRRGG